jgi:hypothetical protein
MDKSPPIRKYKLINDKNNTTDGSDWHLEPNHTHFHLFDDEVNDVQNMLLKRQEIEHELSISKALRSPVAGYISESVGMYCLD